MSDALVRGLQRCGIDVITVATEGVRGRPDSEKLLFATDKRRSIYSFNIRDYRPCMRQRWQAEFRTAASS